MRLNFLTVFFLSLVMLTPTAAQTTARGQILSYNESNASLILSITTSDLRYNQIPLSGGLLSITIAGNTREAYL
ncbi:MAG: hypothetical protein K8I82_09915, partial [Anaerolineae bacterium]|nr:hypothetical protein [Anaerolineae bacterium]